MKNVFYILSSLMLAIALTSLASCNPEGPEGPNNDFEATHTIVEAFDAVYSTEGGKGVYTVTLGTSENGYPSKKGDIQFTLNLYAELDSDPLNAAIPNGTFTASTENEPMTWNPLATGMYVCTEDGGSLESLKIAFLTEGTVYSFLDGDEYTLQVECTAVYDDTELKVKAEYIGAIPFTQGGGNAGSSVNPFTENQNITFKESGGTYYGLWAYPHADDVTVRFNLSEYAEDGTTLIRSWRLGVMLYMTKLDNYNDKDPQIASGVYTVAKAAPFTDTAVPELIIPGSLDNIVGEMIMTGSNFTMTDYEAGENFASHITGGTMTVENNNGEYNITFDFTSPENISIKGSYKGDIVLENRCSNDTDPTNPTANGQTESTLTEDVVLKFQPADSIAVVAYYGNYLFSDRTSWYLSLGATDEAGDFITTEFFTNSVPFGNTKNILPGTYTVEHTFKAGTMLPGFTTFGNYTPLYTWYGDLSSYDPNTGLHTKLAPIKSGTMTIEYLGDATLSNMNFGEVPTEVGKYKFIFNLIDDEGHKVTGEWSGYAAVMDNDLTKTIGGEEEDDDAGHQHGATVQSMRLSR